MAKDCNFKVGDRVRVAKDVESSCGMYFDVGDEGVVIDSTNQKSLDVLFMGGLEDGIWACKGAGLELR